MWDAWANARNRARQLGQPKTPLAHEIEYCTAGDVNTFLTHFILEVRNSKGELYPSKTLYNLCAGICRFLRVNLNRPDLNFLNASNINFNKAQKALDAQMRITTSKGVGVTKKKQAEPITFDQEKVLWEKNLLDFCNSETLSHTVYFYNCKTFGLRARDEHRMLMREQFSFCVDERGHKYLKYQGRVSKNTTGGLAQRQVQLKCVRQYDQDSPNSVYKIFELYMKLIPREGHFYRRPLQGKEIRFSLQVVGSNKLARYIPDIMKSAGFDGQYAGHSGKVTTATTLYQHGVDEQMIKERTGHRSDAVRAYKRTGSAQQEAVSVILDAPPATDRQTVINAQPLCDVKLEALDSDSLSDSELVEAVEKIEKQMTYKHKKFRKSLSLHHCDCDFLSVEEYGQFDIGNPFVL